MFVVFVAGIVLCVGGVVLSLYAYVRYKLTPPRRNRGFPLANRGRLSRGKFK